MKGFLCRAGQGETRATRENMTKENHRGEDFGLR